MQYHLRRELPKVSINTQWDQAGCHSVMAKICRIGQISLNSDCVNWTANEYRLPTEAE